MSRPDRERRRWLVAGAGLSAAAALPAWAEQSAPAGTVSVIGPPLEMPGLSRQRTLRVYLPPGHASGGARYPVIYMHDGQNLFDDATAYAGEWGVDESMDALSRSHGFQAIVVGIDHGGALRINELSPWPNPRFGAADGVAYMRFVVDVVKPFVDGRWRTLPQREHTAIIGSSMGGLISHHAVLRHGAVFGKAGLLSPSYWFSEHAYQSTRATPPRADTRLYLYAGGSEGEGVEDDVRRMHALLAAGSAPPALSLHVVPAARHNEAAWRAEFPLAVRWLFELDKR